MLLLFAEVLIPINVFHIFLQTCNFDCSLRIGKYQLVVSKFESIKNELCNHDCVDTILKYFKLPKPYLLFSKSAMSLSKELRSQDNMHSSIKDEIIAFVRKTCFFCCFLKSFFKVFTDRYHLSIAILF